MLSLNRYVCWHNGAYHHFDAVDTDDARSLAKRKFGYYPEHLSFEKIGN